MEKEAGHRSRLLEGSRMMSAKLCGWSPVNTVSELHSDSPSTSYLNSMCFRRWYEDMLADMWTAATIPTRWAFNIVRRVPKVGRDLGRYRRWRSLSIGRPLYRLYDAIAWLKLSSRVENIVNKKHNSCPCGPIERGSAHISLTS